MELSMRPIQAFLPAVADISSPIFLIEYGLQRARQGDWSEAEYIFQLAREQLSLMEKPFIPELDRLLQLYTSYVQAQQDLQKASKQFAQTESALQAQLILLEKSLPSLRHEKDAGQEHPPTLTVTPLSNPHESVGTEPCACPPPPQGNGLDQPPATPHSTHPTKDSHNLPPLHITCFGHFEVRRSDQPTGQPHKPLPLCQNRNGQTILRFLITQTDCRASADKLMDILWPDDQPAVARRKLQVAISALRCSLNSGLNCAPGSGYILCKERIYQLNPAITITTDVAEFLTLWQAGRQQDEQATTWLYEKACHLRSGPFLVEDLYADWSSLPREQLNQTYLTMCQALSDHYLKTEHYDEAIKWTNAMLKENRYDEKAHQQLMRIYTAQGRRSETLRQYQLCERILSEELSISPMPETVQLFHTLLAGEEPQN
jgi:DNA-binding SARP family transcriptional activator